MSILRKVFIFSQTGVQNYVNPSTCTYLSKCLVYCRENKRGNQLHLSSELQYYNNIMLLTVCAEEHHLFITYYQRGFCFPLLYIRETVHRLFLFCIYCNAYESLLNFYEYTLPSFLWVL